VETDDADPVIDVEERMGWRIVAEELARGEGRGPGGEVIKSLRRDEPGLAGAENVEGFHARRGVSIASELVKHSDRGTKLPDPRAIWIKRYCGPESSSMS